MSCVGASGRDADWEKTGIRRGFEEKHPSLWLSLLRGDRKAETPRGTREPERSRVYQSQYLLELQVLRSFTLVLPSISRPSSHRLPRPPQWLKQSSSVPQVRCAHFSLNVSRLIACDQVVSASLSPYSSRITPVSRRYVFRRDHQRHP